MTRDDEFADQLRELSRQVRWLRHAILRLLAVLGLVCGGAVGALAAKFLLWIAG